MGKAAKQLCTVCNKFYSATRRDSLYCKPHCRQKARTENAKFMTPKIPRSGVPGITYGRILQRWVVKLKIDGRWEYKGAKQTLKEAIAFHKELINVS